jgi:alpha-N-arabinofuranosidase
MHPPESAAKVTIDPSFTVGPVRRRTFGAFVEHLGRCVYTGIFEPEHATADGDGFRTDVLELTRELGVSTVRYPGGNFVSGYRWEDGVGPVEQRPARLDLAWHSTDPNLVGVDEFAKWSVKAGVEPMMAVNLGTRGIEAALDLLEYANDPSGTALSEQRIANGAKEPYNIRMWCLGNEMDGPWQIGHMSAEDYGKIAARTASAMKTADKDLELVVCGSSGSSMPTFGEWERVVLEQSYDYVDYISCHAYYQERNGDLGSYLASSLDMQYFIETVVATADHVKHKLKSKKTIQLSFDEWNIWYLDEHQASDEVNEEWTHAPRQLEDTFSVADAVVFGNLLITLLKNHDRVAAASLAQLVNVIAPIMTEPGGDTWRQTTFFPFSVTSRLARGEVLRPRIEAGTYTTAVYGEAPLVDAVATADAGQSALFLVNRSQTESIDVTVNVSDLNATVITEALTLHDEDVYAKNTLQDQNRVGLKQLEGAVLEEGLLTVTLPPVSWSAVALG